MGRLLLINGLPGSGTSTLAARYVADRSLSLCMDIDVVRELLGAWQDTPSEAGHLARRLALAMARAREVWLRQDPEQALDQLKARAAGPLTTSQRSAHTMLEHDGGAEVIIPSLHHRLVELERRRPAALPLSPTPGDLDATYRALLELLDTPPRVKIHSPAEGQL